MLRIAALLVSLAALTSCQVVADIETHDPDPLPTDCKLPAVTPGGGRVRLGNLRPTNEKLDFCVRPTGTSSYGRPLFRGNGTGELRICGTGLKYPQVTSPIGVPTGQLDVKIIPWGKTCSAPAVAEKLDVKVTSDATMTLAYMGEPLAAEGDTTPGVLLAMQESPPQAVVQNRRMRFLNTITNLQVDWGVSALEALPTNLVTPFLNQSMGFGQLATPALASNPQFVVDQYGYLSFITTKLPIGAAAKGNPKMLFIDVLEGAGYLTLYAIGNTNSPYPVRGLYCEDLEKDPNDENLQKCTQTDIEAFKVDVFNAGLYGAFAAVEDLRAPVVIRDLAARGTDSDFLCVSEISRHADLDLPEVQKGWTQEALKDAAMAVDGGFRYFAQGQTNLDSQPDEPADIEGNIPEPINRVACGAPVSPDAVNTVYDCLINKCNTKPGDPTGIASGGTNCFSGPCGASALASLLFGDDFAHQCFNCVIFNGLSYVSWGTNRTRCSTDTRRPLAFSGASTSMLLSKFPLTDTEQYVIGTSAFRRIALRSKVTYDGDKSVDVYCVHAPPLLGSNIPYTGPYANNASATNGTAWAEEQALGIKKVIGWIQRKSAGRPAIILGDWSSSAKVLDKAGKVVNGPDGLPAVADVTPDTIIQLQAAFTEAVPEMFKPQCTRCPAGGTGELHNVYNVGFNDPMWTLRVFTYNYGVGNPTQSAELFYNEANRVMLNSTDFGIFGPLSDTFGFRVTLRRQ